MPKPKLACTDRAQWRLFPGKAAERLSAHYRLDCDYGTALITIYKQGESVEPIYLCENHATAFARSAGKKPERPTRTKESQTEAGVKAAIPAEQIAERIEGRNVAIKTGMAVKSAVAAESAAQPSDPPSRVGDAADSLAPAKEEEKIEKKSARVAPAPAPKAPLRDVVFGNSAKALVNETLWNLASGDADLYIAELQCGKTAAEAAEAAGGQLAAIHRKIDEYTAKLEALLSECKTAIDAGAAIDKPLEQAMLDIIGRGDLSEAQQDAAIQQLGALQESMKEGLQREMTAVDVRRITLSLAEHANWGGTSDLPEDLKPAYRALYSSLREALRAALPEAQNLEERLANLYAAKSDLQDAAQTKAKSLQPVAS